MGVELSKALIAIAVSKYNGYENLPGTINSAKKLIQWAEDQDYKILPLTDDLYPEITVELLSEKIDDFLRNNHIDRLIVYFAGHGMVKTTSDQYWLLTDAQDNLKQGINVEAFRRGLQKYGIGSNHPDLNRGQLCLIGDACRNTARDGYEFVGDPILSRRTGFRRCYLDRFFATTLGEFSFQIEAKQSGEAFCLFSEVLLEALSGKAEEAIEKKHAYAPVVTSRKVEEYLEKEVPVRADAFGEEMEPDPLAGFQASMDFYKKIDGQEIDDAKHPMPTENLRNVSMGARVSNPGNSNNKNQNAVARMVAAASHASAAICESPPSHILYPKGVEATMHSPMNETVFHAISNNNSGVANAFFKTDQVWSVIPNYPGTIPIIMANRDNALLYSRHENHIETFFGNHTGNKFKVPKVKDAYKYADMIRRQKHSFPHLAVIAGYLYEYANDYDNILRTAHYMAKHGFDGAPYLPFDLAILCTDNISWKNDFSEAYADLPRVEKVSNIDSDDPRPNFTRKGFARKEKVRLAGTFPVFRQGWTFMRFNGELDIPKEILDLEETLTSHSITSIESDIGRMAFTETFGYEFLALNQQEAAQ